METLVGCGHGGRGDWCREGGSVEVGQAAVCTGSVVGGRIEMAILSSSRVEAAATSSEK